MFYWNLGDENSDTEKHFWPIFDEHFATNKLRHTRDFRHNRYGALLSENPLYTSATSIKILFSWDIKTTWI